MVIFKDWTMIWATCIPQLSRSRKILNFNEG
jgi:hypothetical protein